MLHLYIATAFLAGFVAGTVVGAMFMFWRLESDTLAAEEAARYREDRADRALQRLWR